MLEHLQSDLALSLTLKVTQDNAVAVNFPDETLAIPGSSYLSLSLSQYSHTHTQFSVIPEPEVCSNLFYVPHRLDGGHIVLVLSVCPLFYSSVCPQKLKHCP